MQNRQLYEEAVPLHIEHLGISNFPEIYSTNPSQFPFLAAIKMLVNIPYSNLHWRK